MAHRSRLAGFIIDCQTGDIDAAATFWSGALGLQVGDKQVEGAAEYVEFLAGASGLHIEVQKVQHPSRVHLDIETDDLDAEAARLEALGATKVGFVKRWWVMEAPTGQRFCVVRMKHPEQGATPNVWD
ncbi:MAG TPA: VOC family protein [Luteimonas sp.]|nr:VOC family protein [Luteimonas sp.]